MDDILGMSWRKILQLILAVVTTIIILVRGGSLGDVLVVTDILTMSYLILVCLLCIISKRDMVSSTAVAAMDCALGCILIIYASVANLRDISPILNLILGIVMIILTLFV